MKKEVRTAKCVFCHSQIHITPKMVSEKVVQCDEGMLIGTFFTCPICENEDLKYVDNEKTQEIVETMLKIKTTMLKRQSHKQSYHKKQEEKLKTLERKLSRERKLLTQKYWELFISFSQKAENYTDQAVV